MLWGMRMSENYKKGTLLLLREGNSIFLRADIRSDDEVIELEVANNYISIVFDSGDDKEILERNYDTLEYKNRKRFP